MLPYFVLSQTLIRTPAARPGSSDIRLPNAAPTVNPVESALTENGRVTPLESALPKTLNLKVFRIRTYEKWRGEGVDC